MFGAQQNSSVMTELSVNEHPEIFMEDNRQAKAYTVDIPVSRENGKYSVSSSFSTGNIPWTCQLEEILMPTQFTFGSTKELFFKLVPGGNYSPYVHLSLTLFSISGHKISTNTSSPGINYVKVGSNGLFIKLVSFVDEIKSISCFLKVAFTDSTKAFKNVGMKLLKTLNSGLFCDLTLLVGEKTFPAHRVLLSAQSPVFSAMLSQPMKESRDGVVEIEDCQPEAMEILLRYLYSGTLSETSEEILPQILHLAHKYQIEELTKVCELRLLSQLKLGVAVEYLKLADLYDLKSLKNQVVNLIKLNRNEIFETPAWTELEQSHSKLVIQVLKLCLTS